MIVFLTKEVWLRNDLGNKYIVFEVVKKCLCGNTDIGNSALVWCVLNYGL